MYLKNTEDKYTVTCNTEAIRKDNKGNQRFL